MTHSDGSPRSVGQKIEYTQDEATKMVAEQTRKSLNMNFRQYRDSEQVEDFIARTRECTSLDEIMAIRKEMAQARRENR